MSPARHLLWPAALVLVVGCTRAQPGDVTIHLARSAPGTPVARFDGQAVTAEEISAALAAMSPPLRGRYQSPEARKAYVEDVARFRLLALEAAKEGLANDPDVVAATERMMVHKLLTRALTDTPPSDAEIQTYFQAHQAEFARPEAIRLGEIFIAFDAKDAAARKKALRKAAVLAKKIAALAPTDTAGFAELARHDSDDPRSRAMGGELRYATRELLTRQYGPQVTAAAFGLAKPGDSTSFQTDRGVWIFRLLNRTQAFTPTLAQIRPMIVARLKAVHRQQALAAFVAKTEKEGQLTVDEAAVKAIAVDPSAPAKPLGHPLPDVFTLPTPRTGR